MTQPQNPNGDAKAIEHDEARGIVRDNWERQSPKDGLLSLMRYIGQQEGVAAELEEVRMELEEGKLNRRAMCDHLLEVEQQLATERTRAEEAERVRDKYRGALVMANATAARRGVRLAAANARADEAEGWVTDWRLWAEDGLGLGEIPRSNSDYRQLLTDKFQAADDDAAAANARTGRLEETRHDLRNALGNLIEAMKVSGSQPVPTVFKAFKEGERALALSVAPQASTSPRDRCPRCYALARQFVLDADGERCGHPWHDSPAPQASTDSSPQGQKAENADERNSARGLRRVRGLHGVEELRGQPNAEVARASGEDSRRLEGRHSSGDLSDAAALQEDTSGDSDRGADGGATGVWGGELSPPQALRQVQPDSGATAHRGSEVAPQASTSHASIGAGGGDESDDDKPGVWPLDSEGRPYPPPQASTEQVEPGDIELPGKPIATSPIPQVAQASALPWDQPRTTSAELAGGDPFAKPVTVEPDYVTRAELAAALRWYHNHGSNTHDLADRLEGK